VEKSLAAAGDLFGKTSLRGERYPQQFSR